MALTTLGPGAETSVAVNPANPLNIMVTGTGLFDGDHVGFVRVSSDGGRTWRYGNASLRNIQSVIHDGWAIADPVGTFDASGNAYVGTIVNYIFKSSDGGNNFVLTAPFMKMNDSLLDYAAGTVVHPCYQPPGPYLDYPAVIADGYRKSPYRDNVYVLVRVAAQVDSTNCASGTAFQRSTDGGKTWGSGMWLGQSYVPPYSPFSSDFALSDNRGLAVAPDGTIFLAGNAYCGALGDAMVLRSTDGGASFQKICVDAPDVGVFRVEVAAASASDMFVVIDGSSTTSVGYHLFGLVSHDGGGTWSPASRIDDVVLPDSTHVAIQVNAMWDMSLSRRTGRLDVAWLDWRNNRGNYTLADIYFSYSFDGVSWATNIRLTPEGPYYYCTTGSATNCDGNGNDFMWVTSSYGADRNNAYIVASMGKADCGHLCSALLTRFVTVNFPSSAGVSGTSRTNPWSASTDKERPFRNMTNRWTNQRLIT